MVRFQAGASFLFVLLAGAGVALATQSTSVGAETHAVAEPNAAPTAPFSNGDQFQYSTVNTVVLTLPGQPPVTTVTIANSMESVKYPAKYRGNDAYLLSTTSGDISDPHGYTSKEYVGFVRAGAIYALQQYNYAETDYDGSVVEATLVETFGKPYATLAEYPEKTGLKWADNFPYTFDINEDSASFQVSETGTQDADGAYVETEKLKSASYQNVAKYALKSDGAGTLKSETTGSPTVDFAFGLPIDEDGSEVIPVKINGQPPIDVPDWFPGGGKPLDPLEDYGSKIISLGKAPASCGAQSGVAAYDVRETGYFLDPVGGEYGTQTVDFYDSPTLGLVCSIDLLGYSFYANTSSGAVTLTVADTRVQVLTGESTLRTGAPSRAPLVRLRARYFMPPGGPRQV